jgi:hypothetical protein
VQEQPPQQQQQQENIHGHQVMAKAHIAFGKVS